MQEAFTVMRRYARDHNLRLTEVAHAVVTRELSGRLLLDHHRDRTTSQG